MALDVQQTEVEQVSLSKPALSWVSWLALGVPALVAVVLMAPRILHAQFGLFDDAAYLSVSRSIEAGAW
ncbi:MAG TPA: hypothetical protein VFI11_12705, partial [Anaerolineales bacterium]|nr:hypothetical protein [Anaerolineales bacterium]